MVKLSYQERWKLNKWERKDRVKGEKKLNRRREKT